MKGWDARGLARLYWPRRSDEVYDGGHKDAKERIAEAQSATVHVLVIPHCPQYWLVVGRRLRHDRHLSGIIYVIPLESSKFPPLAPRGPRIIGSLTPRRHTLANHHATVSRGISVIVAWIGRAFLTSELGLDQRSTPPTRSAPTPDCSFSTNHTKLTSRSVSLSSRQPSQTDELTRRTRFLTRVPLDNLEQPISNRYSSGRLPLTD
jgi:hypothetical protein